MKKAQKNSTNNKGFFHKLFSKKNNKTAGEVVVKNIPNIDVSNFQGIGKRVRQEDSFFVSNFNDKDLLGEKGFFAVVADGMGGLSNGAEMSAMVTRVAKEYFATQELGDEGPDVAERIYLENFIKVLDREAKTIQDDPEEEDSGSTMLAVWIRGNKMYFASVGDSRIYLSRNGELYQINREHNTGSKLALRMAQGHLTLEEYKDITGKSGLTSFIGIYELDTFDVAYRPLMLEPGDTILLFSDGVFGTLSEAEIQEQLVSGDCGLSARFLKAAVDSIDKPKQDNYTGVIIEYKG